MTEPRALAFAGSRLLLIEERGGLRLPTVRELAEGLGEARLEAVSVPATVAPAELDLRAFDLEDDPASIQGYRRVELRAAYHVLSEPEFRAAGTARQKVEWHRTHAYCSRCGDPTEPHDTHEAMGCPACGQLHFARIAPAVIVLVQREREALLARSPHFTSGVYSTLAGFVEPGESLEECVHREIREEVGVEVQNLRYFGSQPHPFPHSLMLGFVADWHRGEIRIDPVEIEDARWFASDALPKLPHPMSIARALIEDFVNRVDG